MSVIFNELFTADGLRIGVITLDSPKTLNALNLSMTRAIYQQLQQWANDPQLAFVFLHSSLPKAFCAGGDVRQIVESCRQHPHKANELAQQFFSQEYDLDRLLHHYPKLIIGWGEGYVLGGGMGLLQACSIRIVTPSSRLGMPEISIGLFPDVGAAWFLARIPQRLGLFLALTASQLNATDALAIGWADRCLLESQKQDLLQGLQQLNWSQQGEQQLHQLLKNLEKKVSNSLPEAVWQPRLPIIREVLDQPDLPSIWHAIVNLKQSNDEVLAKAATTLAEGCPMTAWLIWEQLRRFTRCSISEILRIDYIISQNCCLGNDFIEGVRARLIDKDNNPQWTYQKIEDVPYSEVDKHFK